MGMSLSQSDLNEIRDLFRAEIKGAILNVPCPADCPGACKLPDAARTELTHFMGMIRDIGQGDHACGIETMRENHQLIAAMRSTGHKVGVAMVISFMLGISALIGFLFRHGIGHFLESFGKK